MRPYHQHVHFTGHTLTRYTDEKLHGSFNVTCTCTHTAEFCADTTYFQQLWFTPRNACWHPVLLGFLQDPMLVAFYFDDQHKTNLFDYDYAAMRRVNAAFRNELLAHVMHPNNVAKLNELGLIEA
jgi:hypothetical protein